MVSTNAGLAEHRWTVPMVWLNTDGSQPQTVECYPKAQLKTNQPGCYPAVSISTECSNVAMCGRMMETKSEYNKRMSFPGTSRIQHVDFIL